MRLKILNENKEKILILIHPDCLPFHGYTQDEYIKKLKEHLPKFNIIITMKFSYDTDEYTDEKGLKETNDIIERYSTYIFNDKNCGKDLFQNEIGLILMEHPNARLYVSGGYQNACLMSGSENLCTTLSWLFDELNYEVAIYKPLVYKPDLSKDEPWWDYQFGNYWKGPKDNLHD